MQAGQLTPGQATVLALVVESPAHGYDVWQRYDTRFGALMPVTASAIYKTLSALEGRGLVEPMDEAAAQRRGPRYRATATGGRAHREWLAGAFREDPLRRELLRRLLAARNPAVMREILDRCERACLAELQATPVTSASAGLAERLLAEDQRISLQARMTFVQQARRMLAEEQPG